MIKKYQITPLVWLVKDEDSVKFHVENHDYFGTVATILSLIKGQMEKTSGEETASLNKIFDNLEVELMFLQKNYQINPRSKKKKTIPKGKLKSQ